MSSTEFQAAFFGRGGELSFQPATLVEVNHIKRIGERGGTAAIGGMDSKREEE